MLQVAPNRLPLGVGGEFLPCSLAREGEQPTQNALHASWS